MLYIAPLMRGHCEIQRGRAVTAVAAAAAAIVITFCHCFILLPLHTKSEAFLRTLASHYRPFGGEGQEEDDAIGHMPVILPFSKILPTPSCESRIYTI
jgi:hypothetical protein